MGFCFFILQNVFVVWNVFVVSYGVSFISWSLILLNVIVAESFGATVEIWLDIVWFLIYFCESVKF